MYTRSPEENRAIAGTILAVTLPRRPATIEYRFENQPAGTSTLLDWARRRLEKQYPTVVCEHADSAGLNACLEAQSPPAHTVVCCNLGAAFLPDSLIRDALESHRQQGVDCTKVVGLPKGVSVACVGAKALLALRGLSVARNDADPAALIALLVLERLTGGTDAPPLTIATHEAKLGAAPKELHIETRWSVDLARRVIASGDEDLLACWARLEREPLTFPALGRPPSFDRRLRVLFFSAQSGWSGAEAALVRAVAAMDKRKVAASAFVPMDGIFAQSMRRAGCHVDLFETNIASPTPPNVELLGRLLDTTQPHVVHINSAGGASALEAAGSRGIPCVQHLRIADMRHFADAFPRVAAKIAVSRYIQRLAGDAGDTFVIPDGIDAEYFSPEAASRAEARRTLGLQERSLVFLVAARIDPQKRHDLLLEAFRMLLDARPDSILLMAGDGAGHPDWVRRLDGLIAKLGLGAAVRKLGFVRDVRLLYAASDAYVACGEGEGQGCAVLEAMSMRLATLVADHGGQAELLETGRSGVLFPAGDTAALATALLEMRDSSFRRDLGRRARQRVLDLYTVQECAERLLERLLSAADSQRDASRTSMAP